jgi:hypothetical protein
MCGSTPFHPLGEYKARQGNVISVKKEIEKRKKKIR